MHLDKEEAPEKPKILVLAIPPLKIDCKKDTTFLHINKNVDAFFWERRCVTRNGMEHY